MKNTTKRCLSALLALIMLVLLVPFTAMAETSYKDVDYSTILYPNYDYDTDIIESTDPQIMENISSNELWEGAAQGYMVYLVKGNEYTFSITTEATNAAFISRAVAVLDFDFEGSSALTDDILAIGTNSATDSTLELVLTYTPEESGFYKILSWGICTDSSENEITGNDTYISVYVEADLDYTDVDYSYSISASYDGRGVGAFNDFVSEADVWIYLDNSLVNWSGFAQGYTVYLVGGENYTINMTLDSSAASYLDRSIAVLSNELTGDFETDCKALVTEKFSDTTTLELSLEFTPGQSGRYKILSWGYVEDDAGQNVFGSADTSIKIEVEKDFYLDCYDVEYSEKISVGNTYNGYIGFDFPYVNDYSAGFAKGYTIDLEADTEYIFEFTTEGLDENTDYCAASIVVFDKYFNLISAESNSDYVDSISTKVLTIVPATDTYYVLVVGEVVADGVTLLGKELTATKLSVRSGECKDYEVASVDDLKAFASELENQEADVFNINITADIDMSKEEWTSVEFLNKKISIQSNNHAITGLDAPLFGDGAYLEVSDLAIEINYTFDDPTNDCTFKSALAGFVNTAYLYNCHANGEININAFYVESIGGLVSDVYSGRLEFCSSNVNININAVDEACYIGGFMPYAVGCEITNCFYEGEINVLSLGSGLVGGFVGDIRESFIAGCYAKGKVNATDFVDDVTDYYSYNVGGLFGSCQVSEVRNCYAEVDVSSDHGDDVGGFVGENGGSIYLNCYATGNVVSFEDGGGFAGYTYSGSFYNCYAMGDVTALRAGGFVGEMDYKEEFYNCYAIGDVKGNSETAVIAKFAAYAAIDYAPVFENCFVKADDSSVDALGSVGVYDETLYDYVACDDSVILQFDITDDFAMSTITKVFNEAVDTYTTAGVNGLLKWTGRHACGTPIFVYETIEAPEAPSFDKTKKGDINSNGIIDSMDYVFLKRAYFGTYVLKNINVGDINGNGIIDSMDYVLVKRAYFGTFVLK